MEVLKKILLYFEATETQGIEGTDPKGTRFGVRSFFSRSEAGTDASEIGKERGRNGQAKIRGRFRSFSVPFSAKMGVKLEKD